MLLIATAPPMPFSIKLIVTLVMLTVMGLVMGLVGRRRPRGRSIILAVATALAIVTALEYILPSSEHAIFELHNTGVLAAIVLAVLGVAQGLHDRGVLAAIVGALSAAYFLRVGNRELSSRRLDFLARIAFATAPLIGLLLGVFAAYQAYPEDRAACLALGIGLGFFTGLMAAGVLGVAAMLSAPRSSSKLKKPDEVDQEGKPNP